MFDCLFSKIIGEYIGSVISVTHLKSRVNRKRKRKHCDDADPNAADKSAFCDIFLLIFLISLAKKSVSFVEYYELVVFRCYSYL